MRTAPTILKAIEPVLDLAVSNGLRSVAFPCLSTGMFGLDKVAAADIASGAVTSWLRHRVHVARCPKMFPGPESAASLPGAAATSKKRAGTTFPLFAATGGHSTKTRRGMTAAGEQPTATTTGRMLLVEDTEDGASPSKRATAVQVARRRDRARIQLWNR